MKHKAYTEMELVQNIEVTIESIFGCELLNSCLAPKLDKKIHVSYFKNFVLHTIIFKNGIVKYNLITPKETYYTLTYKQVLSQLKKIFTKV